MASRKGKTIASLKYFLSLLTEILLRCVCRATSSWHLNISYATAKDCSTADSNVNVKES